MNEILRIIIKCISRIYGYQNWIEIRKYLNKMYSNWLKTSFGKCGENISIQAPAYLKGPEYMSVGEYFGALPRLRMECWDSFQGKKYNPELIIGKNVSLNFNVHIGCIQRITIRDHVLIGSNVFITDHNHGFADGRDAGIAPACRELSSKGPVEIGERVWIGENAVIMPGVSIGADSIVGANAVVTKCFPAKSVIAGIPAKIIRTLE